MRNKYLLLMAAGFLLTSCNENGELPGADAPANAEGQRISFVFPGTSQGIVPYTKAIASEAENKLETLDIYVFGEDTLSSKTPKSMVLEEIFRSGGGGTEENSFDLSATGENKTATISITQGERKSFYFVANGRSHQSLSEIRLHETDTVAFRKLMTNKQTDLLGCPVLMSAICDTTMSTVKGSIKVSLIRRVARFDISNDAVATGFVIQKVGLENVPEEGPVFPETSFSTSRYAKLPVIDFSSLENSNAGETNSVFYLYPLDSTEMHKSEVKLTLIGKSTDGAVQVVQVPMLNYENKQPITINPNNRYKVVVEERGLGTLVATLSVQEWQIADTLNVAPDLGTIVLKYEPKEEDAPAEGGEVVDPTPKADIAFENNTLTVGAAMIAEAIRIDVESGSEWELVTDTSVDWLTVEKKKTESTTDNPDVVDYIAITTTKDNLSQNMRETIVMVQNVVRPSIRQPLVVRQKGATAAENHIDITADFKWMAGISFSNNILNVPGLKSNAEDDETFSIALNISASGTGWEIANSSELNDWVKAQKSDDVLTLTIDQNTTKDTPREQKIELKITNTDITRSFTVNQAAPDYGTIRLSCDDMDAAGNVTVPVAGFTDAPAGDESHRNMRKISVAANTAWECIITYNGNPDDLTDTTTATDWLNNSSTTPVLTPGTYNGNVYIKAAANGTTSRRSATVTIVNKKDNYVSQSITFIQEAGQIE